MTDVRPPKQRTVPEAPVRPENLRATFEYHDEQGRFLFAVDRHEAAGCRKAIRQWRLDAEGRRVYSLKGVRPVPFRLHELLQAETVFIVEGEPKVLALLAWGLAATCNPMGAGKWRSEYNAYFHAKQVVILPDQDAPGRRHAQRIAAALRPVAASVKVVELPGLPPKGDIVDWQAAGHDPDELLRLVEATGALEVPPPSGEEMGVPATEDAIALRFAQEHRRPETEPYSWATLRTQWMPLRLHCQSVGQVTLERKPKQSQAPREISIPQSDFQPSKAELEEDLRIKRTFKQAIQALVRPVRIRRVIPKRTR